MTFLLLVVCVYCACKSWAAANVPAASPEEQRLRIERHSVRQQQMLSLLATGVTWLVGRGFNARKR